MKPQTSEIKSKILQLEEAEDRIRQLKDTYKDETAYIIASGPSLNNYTHEYLQEFLSDKLTIRAIFISFSEYSDGLIKSVMLDLSSRNLLPM